MSTRRIAFGISVILIAAAYAGGYWPERQRRVAAQAESAVLRSRVADLEARQRIGALLGDVLSLSEAVSSMNYGQAQEMSSGFFDRVQAEALALGDSDLAPALARIARQRDAVTAALARGDQRALDPLRQAQLLLREALGYPPPPPGAQVPAPAAPAAPAVEPAPTPAAEPPVDADQPLTDLR